MPCCTPSGAFFGASGWCHICDPDTSYVAAFSESGKVLAGVAVRALKSGFTAVRLIVGLARFEPGFGLSIHGSVVTKYRKPRGVKIGEKERKGWETVIPKSFAHVFCLPKCRNAKVSTIKEQDSSASYVVVPLEDTRTLPAWRVSSLSTDQKRDTAVTCQQ